MHDVSSKHPGPAMRTRTTPPASRRPIIVLAAALVAGGAVAAGVLLSNRSDPAPGGPTVPGIAAAPAGRHDVDDPLKPPVTSTPPEVVEAQVKQVLSEVEKLDQTVFAKEVEAQEYEEYFIRLWDDFRAARDKSAVLEAAAFETLAYGTPAGKTEHDWGISVVKFEGRDNAVDRPGWRTLLAGLREAGYRPTELEFHQSAFEHEAGQPARSTVATLVHLLNDEQGSRQVVRAKLQVEWSDEPDRPGEGGMFVPRAIEVTDLTVATRTAGPGFEPVALPGGSSEHGLPLRNVAEFVAAYDLDGDGLSEIVVPGENLLLRNRGKWRFEREEIVPGSNGMDASVLADFTGDGLPDLLCRKGSGVYLVRGVAGGRFATSPPEQAVTLDFPAAHAIVITAGDVDGDRDLDAWFGQYKPPYTKGQMPTPYYDANDGYSGALLINDGHGRFTDRTVAAGLAAKRTRRTLAASLLDLDGDRDIDLLVNNDFAGLDIYYNDGQGYFTEVTGKVIDERHNFGMGHTFADFNLDGRLDMYTIGMSSTTARRLTAMKAGRQEFPEHQNKRPQMGYGNRMFLAPPATDGPPSAAPRPYVQPTFKDDVARTGWSWGTSSPDFDNDGDPDIYVANGNISGSTCRDYCTTYWRRDIYFGNSNEDPVFHSLFFDHGMGRDESWNGFEHNVLYMNEGGKSFLNVAHLFGVAFEFDSRNVISDDLDADGKMDLLVVENQLLKQSRHLHVMRNNWPTPHNWVGVRLAETKPGFSPVGAEIRVHVAAAAGAAGTPPRVARIVTGDSLQAQHANLKHFGLGQDDKVEAIEVTWPNGQTTRVNNPPINRYHDLRPTAEPAGAAAAAR